MRILKKYLKRIKTILILLLGVLTLIQCDFFYEFQGGKYDIYEDRPLIEEGDTLIYKCEHKVDSLIVVESQVYGIRERNEKNKEASYWGRIEQLDCVDSCVIFKIYLDKDMYSISNVFPIRFSGNASYVTVADLGKKNDKYSMEICAIEFRNLYNLDFRCKQDVVCVLDSAFYSKRFGILKYITVTGEEFVLSEESLEMLMARE